MKRLASTPTSTLVDRVAEIGVAQDRALLHDDRAAQKKLVLQLKAIDDELRARGRNDRLALTKLYDHPNIQVRYDAAKLTLGVAPVEARRVIEWIAQSGFVPQMWHAGMTLLAIDEGIFKPN